MAAPLFSFLNEINVIPNPVTSVALTVNNTGGKLTASWVTSLAGRRPAGYLVSFSTIGGSSLEVDNIAYGTNTVTTSMSLVFNTQYRAYVATSNLSLGKSIVTTSATDVLYGLVPQYNPSTVTSVAFPGGQSYITVNWTAPIQNPVYAPLYNYYISFSGTVASGTNSGTLASTILTFNSPATLIIGNSYTPTVYSVNTIGNSTGLSGAAITYGSDPLAATSVSIAWTSPNLYVVTTLTPSTSNNWNYASSYNIQFSSNTTATFSGATNFGTLYNAPNLNTANQSINSPTFTATNIGTYYWATIYSSNAISSNVISSVTTSTRWGAVPPEASSASMSNWSATGNTNTVIANLLTGSSNTYNYASTYYAQFFSTNSTGSATGTNIDVKQSVVNSGVTSNNLFITSPALNTYLPGDYIGAVVTASNTMGITSGITTSPTRWGVIPLAPATVTMSWSNANTNYVTVSWTIATSFYNRATLYITQFLTNTTNTTTGATNSGALVETGPTFSSAPSASGLTIGNYYFAKVWASNVFGSNSLTSGATSGVKWGTSAIAPTTVTMTNWADTANTNSVTVTWSAVATGNYNSADKYNLQYYYNTTNTVSLTNTYGSLISNLALTTLTNSIGVSDPSYIGYYFFANVWSSNILGSNSTTSGGTRWGSLPPTPKTNSITQASDTQMTTTFSSNTYSYYNAVVSWSVAFYSNSSATTTSAVNTQTLAISLANTTATTTTSLTSGTYFYSIVYSINNLGSNSLQSGYLRFLVTPSISSVTMSSSGVATITWGSVGGATSYTLYYKATTYNTAVNNGTSISITKASDPAETNQTATASLSTTFTCTSGTVYNFKISCTDGTITKTSTYSHGAFFKSSGSTTACFIPTPSGYSSPTSYNVILAGGGGGGGYSTGGAGSKVTVTIPASDLAIDDVVQVGAGAGGQNNGSTNSYTDIGWSGGAGPAGAGSGGNLSFFSNSTKSVSLGSSYYLVIAAGGGGGGAAAGGANSATSTAGGAGGSATGDSGGGAGHIYAAGGGTVGAVTSGVGTGAGGAGGAGNGGNGSGGGGNHDGAAGTLFNGGTGGSDNGGGGGGGAGYYGGGGGEAMNFVNNPTWNGPGGSGGSHYSGYTSYYKEHNDGGGGGGCDYIYTSSWGTYPTSSVKGGGGSGGAYATSGTGGYVLVYW